LKQTAAAGVLPLLLLLAGLELGVSFFGPLLPQVQREFALSAGTVALALAIYNGIRLIFNVPMSRFIAHSPLPALLAAGGIIFAGGAVVVALAPSFAFILLGRAIMGLGSALFFLTIQFWLARVATAENKARLFSFHQLAGIFGSAVGPAVAGLVAGWLSWRYAAAFPVVAGILTLVIGRRLPYPTARLPEPSTPGSGAGDHAPLRDVLGPGIAMLAILIFSNGLMNTMVPLFAARDLHMGPAAIGGILMLGTVQRFVAAFAGARLVGMVGSRNTVIGSLAILGLVAFLFVPARSVIALIAAISLASWANLGGSFVIALVTDRLAERHWGTALGLNRSIGDVGAMISPILAGVLIDSYSFATGFAVMASLIVVCAAVSFWLTASPPQHTSPKV
jgi:predicted MFS family arabinose efflux permease